MISGVRASSIRIEFDLVDDGEVVRPLHHVGRLVDEVVAQVVETELVVGAVGDVGVVGALALGLRKAVHDDADAQAQELVDAAHPLGVAVGEVVVDGDDVDALALQRVQVDRQGRDQRLAFAGAHLGDAAVMQHHAADHLHVEVALAERALGGLAHHREGLVEDGIEAAAALDAAAQLVGLGAQRIIAQRRHLRLERVDPANAPQHLPDLAVVRGAEDFLEIEHARGSGPNRGL